MNETMTSTSIEAGSGANAPLEKIALETYVPPAKPSLVGLSRAEIAERLGEIGVAPAQRKMRVQQLWHWIYVRGAKNFRRDDQHLQGNAQRNSNSISPSRAPKWSPSRFPTTAPANGCCACRAATVEKAHEVECVYIPETDRGTLCVSSQVGCTLNCSFCHTGTQRLVRNLTAGEIVGQIMVARDRLNDWADRETPTGGRLVTNVVMMGMGEPSTISTRCAMRC